MTPLQLLTDLKHQQDCAKYPSIKPSYVPRYKYNPNTANGLTRCVIDWIQLNGGQAERINSTGRMIDDSFEFTDSVGFRRRTGGVKWIPGTGTKGTADISAIVNGKPWKIEIKIGKDRQSEAQRRYEASIQRAGGIYLIARTFEQFYKDYNKLIQQ